MDAELAAVATFNRRHEADFAKGFLDDAGIESVVAADDAGGTDMGLSFTQEARLMVREEDAARARRVLEEAGMLDEEDEGA